MKSILFSVLLSITFYQISFSQEHRWQTTNGPYGGYINFMALTVWDEYCNWMVDMTIKFRKSFMPRVRELDLTVEPEQEDVS